MLTEAEQIARAIKEHTAIAKDIERVENVERVEQGKLAEEQWGDAARLCPSLLYGVSNRMILHPVVTDDRVKELLGMTPTGREILRAEEKATAKPHDAANAATESPRDEGDWLAPTSKADMANRLGNVGRKKVASILKGYGLKQAGNRQLWTVRLDKMPTNLRQKLEQVK